MIRLLRCCWRARSVPLRGSYFNDIIHPQHTATGKESKYKKENCEEQERLSDGETDRNKEL